MPDIAALIQDGTHNPWFYLPLAVLLGALHALEPGHAKSVMAAFIVAIRGTARHAVILGTGAAVGHSLVIWALAGLGLWLGDKLILGHAEPWLVLASGIAVMILAVQIFRQMRGSTHRHDHHHHDHHHHDHHGHDHDHGHHHHHHHDDDHAAHHARQIANYAGRTLSDREVFWFGLTGGLLPCPAALAVLLLCLQVKAVGLGFAMVLGFSLGLALTLVAVGLAAAWGAQRVATGGRYAALTAQLPLLSAALVLVIGMLMAARGIFMLAG